MNSSYFVVPIIFYALGCSVLIKGELDFSQPEYVRHSLIHSSPGGAKATVGVKIRRVEGGDTFFQSGVLLNEEWILTAAHGIPFKRRESDPSKPTRTAQVSVFDRLSGGWTSREVDFVDWHPLFKRKGLQDGFDNAYNNDLEAYPDLALVHLKNPLPFDQVKFPTIEKPTQGASVVANGIPPDGLAQGTVLNDLHLPHFAKVDLEYVSDTGRTIMTNATHAEPGDSGSGLFRGGDATGKDDGSPLILHGIATSIPDHDAPDNLKDLYTGLSDDLTRRWIKHYTESP